MVSATTVLTIGRDAPLQSSRTLLLKHAGYSVVELYTDASVLKFMEGETNVDLVLICHSVEVSSRMPLCTALRMRYPATPILMLYSKYEFIPPQVTSSLQSLGNPEELLDVVHTLICSSCSDPQNGVGTPAGRQFFA